MHVSSQTHSVLELNFWRQVITKNIYWAVVQTRHCILSKLQNVKYRFSHIKNTSYYQFLSKAEQN